MGDGNSFPSVVRVFSCNFGVRKYSAMYVFRYCTYWICYFHIKINIILTQTHI